SLTLNQAFVTCLCQQFFLVFSIDLDLKTIDLDLKTIKKATMIIISTGELNCCGGGWLSRGFCVWWQILFDI
ncbi:hypothetical protein, partial [Leuconostoc mesenteroides]|uniref:hypothetical protein n=1 Tax=Leuconostoc mesenteroides TaxID=1245 RepID=UPI00235EFF39